MTPQALYSRLWSCATQAEALAILAKIPHKLFPIANRRNNKGPIRANRDPIAALIEGTTNAHDAVIRFHQERNRFATPPTSVEDALAQIAGHARTAHVYALVQLEEGKFKKHHAVTIVDAGIGMTAEGMLNGVLTFGSEDKVLDCLQFGSFGQGSASLFGHSKFSFIGSRRAGTNTMVFTAVWLHKPEGQIHSYVYLTQPDGSLFQFVVDASSPGITLNALTQEKLRTNVPIVPQHGTIRRQLEIDIVEYFTQKADSLYYALNDRLFGVPGVVRMMGDDDEGHINNRRGRRWDFNATPVGQKLRGSQWVMKGHLLPTNVAIHRRNDLVGLVQFEAWVIGSYRSKPTKNQPTGEMRVPARHMMEGSNRAAPRSILVTLNGQTLARLNSNPIFAKFRSIAENIILEVRLDFLPEHTLQDAELFLASRDGLVEWFQRVLLDEVKRYIEDQPELARLADEMMPTDDAPEMDNKSGLEINRVLRDPILGPVFGYQTIPGLPVEVTTEPPTDPKRRVRNPAEPIELVDPPTWLEIRKQTIIRNATNWLTLHTNAPDHYASALKLTLPDFLTQLGPATLTAGKMTVGIDCNASPLGMTGMITAALRSLRTERLVTIVPRKETPKKMVILPGTELVRVERQGPPSTRLIEVTPASAHWAMYFSAVDDPALAAINYNWKKDENEIIVAVHTEFPALRDTRRHLERRFGPIIARDYHQRVCRSAQFSAMIFCRNGTIGGTGANDEAALEVMADIMRSNVISIGTLYRMPSFRNTVLSGGVVDDDEG